MSSNAAALLQHVAICRRGVFYRRVIFVRPDVLLLKDIRLADAAYDPHERVLHVNAMEGGLGDFHFVLSSSAAVGVIARLPEEARRVPVIAANAWIKPVFERAGFSLVRDKLVPGVDEEVYRKVPFKPPMKRHGYDFFRSRYGLIDSGGMGLWLRIGEQNGVHRHRC